MDGAELERDLAAVRARIRDACGRAGRDPTGVTLVAVTKSVGPDAITALLELGVRDIGENRQQSAFSRLPLVPLLAGRFAEPPARDDDARLHFIGPLQRNKAARVAAVFDVIHSVDSLRLAETLGRAAGSGLEIFIQVNVAGEAQKQGLDPADAAQAAAIARAGGVTVLGLMCMAPLGSSAEEARPHFRALAALARHWLAEGVLPASATGLSMGMSGDYEAAIEEGATHVRVGSALFGQA
jgi:PLP dependent protein